MTDNRTVTLLLDEPLWDVDEAAVYLKVRPSWVRDAVRGSRLPCYRIGRHMRFTKTMLSEWVARNRIEPGARFASRTRRPA